jgi:hypothetical protein
VIADIFHPLWGVGYQFWSGIGSDVGELAIITGVAAFLYKHNCHVRGCPRLSWHPDPGTGHPVCKKHHPDHPEGTPSGS